MLDKLALAVAAGAWDHQAPSTSILNHVTDGRTINALIASLKPASLASILNSNQAPIGIVPAYFLLSSFLIRASEPGHTYEHQALLKATSDAAMYLISLLSGSSSLSLIADSLEAAVECFRAADQGEVDKVTMTPDISNASSCLSSSFPHFFPTRMHINISTITI